MLSEAISALSDTAYSVQTHVDIFSTVQSLYDKYSTLQDTIRQHDPAVCMMHFIPVYLVQPGHFYSGTAIICYFCGILAVAVILTEINISRGKEISDRQHSNQSM